LDLTHRPGFTIPKILRSYFRYDWKPFGAVFYQTFGESPTFIPIGLFWYWKAGSIPMIADRQLVKAWREILLRLVQKKKLIDQKRVDLIRSWKPSLNGLARRLPGVLL